MNDRSVIMQTDGDMLINVGGSYSGSDPETIASRGFNEGRFDLRVNVTDKGFTTSTFEPVTDADGNPVDLDIGYRITRVGSKSYDIHQGIFVKGEDAPSFQSIHTFVMFNFKEQKSIPVSDIIKENLREIK